VVGYREVYMKERVVLVTGASSGIGRATAVRLAAAGFVVWASAEDDRGGSDEREAGQRLGFWARLPAEAVMTNLTTHRWLAGWLARKVPSYSTFADRAAAG
jgi:NAD(P)-dependent dehydrogenase (short-subunit alcohol dehydrogenase family)